MQRNCNARGVQGGTSCTGSVQALGPYVGDTKQRMVSASASYLDRACAPAGGST